MTSCIEAIDEREGYLRVEITVDQGDYVGLRKCFLNISHLCRTRMDRRLIVIRHYPKGSTGVMSIEKLRVFIEEVSFWFYGITVAYVSEHWGTSNVDNELTFMRRVLLHHGLTIEFFHDEVDAVLWMRNIIDNQASGC